MFSHSHIKLHGYKDELGREIETELWFCQMSAMKNESRGGTGVSKIALRWESMGFKLIKGKRVEWQQKVGGGMLMSSC